VNCLLNIFAVRAVSNFLFVRAEFSKIHYQAK